MYLKNLDLNTLDYDVLKADLLNTIDDEEILTEEDVKQILASMYTQAGTKLSSLYYTDADAVNQVKAMQFSFDLAGNSIWQELKKFLCEVLNELSTDAEIVDKIIEFLLSIIPGGIIISFLVKKIVKYILNLGYQELCPVSVN
jgi:hypothetical protein